ncbi:substrate-binding domain-containing protein, partial [Escherichia coli]|nr:substrate-binding domain-containing protein [Escherichia coli]
AKCAKRPGKVALFVGSHGFHGHELREIGLRSYFREHAPQFSVLETFVTHEAVEVTQDILAALLRREPDMVGCYVGGGGSEGAIAAMRAAALAEPPVLICNEDTPLTRQALTDGIASLAIVTPVARLSRELVSLMGQVLNDGGSGGQSFLQFDLLLPESF